MGHSMRAWFNYGHYEVALWKMFLALTRHLKFDHSLFLDCPSQVPPRHGNATLNY